MMHLKIFRTIAKVAMLTFGKSAISQCIICYSAGIIFFWFHFLLPTIKIFSHCNSFSLRGTTSVIFSIEIHFTPPILLSIRTIAFFAFI